MVQEPHQISKKYWNLCDIDNYRNLEFLAFADQKIFCLCDLLLSSDGGERPPVTTGFDLSAQCSQQHLELPKYIQ